MNALLISLLVPMAIVAGSLAGAWLGARLPEHHLSSATKEIVKFGAGTIATLAALVLGLLVASAKTSYDAKAAELEQAAAKIILLDQILRQYGPDAKPARDALRAAIVARQDMTWVKAEAKTGNARHTDAIHQSIASLAPASDAQRALQTRALQVVDDFMQTRWLFITQSAEGVSAPLLVVLVVWLTTIAFCTALFAPRNSTVTAVALMCAVSVGAALFLIVEMYSPFEGLLKISDAPLQTALRYLEDR